MTTEAISNEVKRLLHIYHERDPYELCSAMNILMTESPMGTYEGACKGFCMKMFKQRIITVNSDLSKALQRIIVAHELGHYILHDDVLSVQAFHEFTLFDMTLKTEYEANIFAAELLLPDDVVLEKLNDDISFFGAAAELCIPPELLDFKFRTLKRRGYKVIDPPLMCQSNWLRNAKDGEANGN